MRPACAAINLQSMPSNAQAPVTAEEKRAALDLVLHSRTFARAEQLRSLLTYLCKAEEEGRQKELTEYAIGRDVLGRPEDYSPVEDSSVRTRAYELRNKLEKFYHLEARDAEVRIVVPKGTYVPHYERYPVPDRAPQHAAEFVELTESNRRVIPRGTLPWWGWAAIVLSFAVGAAGLSAFVLGTRQRPSVDPIVKEAWGPLAQPDANVLMSVATPLHLTVGPDTHKTFGTNIYPAPPEAYPRWRLNRPLAPEAKLGLVFTDNVLGFGTMNAVLLAANTLRSMGVAFQMLPERVAPLPTFRNRNVILFGAPVDSNAVTRIHESLPLVVDYEESVTEFVIRDRKNGKFTVPEKDEQGDFRDVYGLITVLNNREAGGKKLGMVSFSGITSTGTHGAAEFFSSPASLRDLKARFARDGLRGFPASYQVVVRCRFSNMLLLSYEAVDHRIVPK